MANLTYNSNIFTKVNKWDDEYTYLGIQVTGKFNQHNGQDFYILDAIDIDWNGAYVNQLNSYLYSTEDLINVLNLLSSKNTELYNNLTNNYITNDKLADITNNLTEYINEQTSYAIENIGTTVLAQLMTQYEVLASISDIVLDRSRYLRINYSDIVKNGIVNDSRQYFIYNEAIQKFEVVDNEYILNNPDAEYYIFLIEDIIKLNTDVSDLYNIVGEIIKNDDNTYSYTGFYERFNNIEYNVSYITYYIDNIADYVDKSYYYAYTAYNVSYVNSYLIGEHTKYNTYTKIEDWSDPKVKQYLNKNLNNIWIKDPDNPDNYISITYSPYNDPSYEYYLFYNKIDGYGLSKDVDDLNDKIVENSYLLYNLSVESTNPNYLFTNIVPNEKVNKNRKIIVDLKNSYVDPYTGEITYGVTTYQNIINSTSYLFSWEILK